MLFLITLFTFTLGYPHALTEPEDCYVANPLTDCSATCKNKGGSADCLYAMGQCLTTDSTSTITVNGIAVDANQDIAIDYSNGITVSVSHDTALRFFASVTQNVAEFTNFDENTIGSICSKSLIRATGDVSNSANTFTINPLTGDGFSFIFVRAGGYGQTYGSRINIKPAATAPSGDFKFVNVFPYVGQDAIVASAFYNNEVYYNGETIALQRGETKKFENVALGDIITALKPISVTGSSANNEDRSNRFIFNWAQLSQKGREFAIRVARGKPRFSFYATEDAEIKVHTVSSEGITEVDSSAITAGESFTKFYDFEKKMMYITSTGDVVVGFVSTGSDQLILEPMVSELFGSPSRSLYVANPHEHEITLLCGNGQTRTSSSSMYSFTGASHWTYPGCRLSAAGPIAVSQIGDGDGGDGTTFRPASQFGRVGVLGVEMSSVKIISNVENTVCEFGGQTATLSGDVIFDFLVTGDTPVGVISCNNPVMVIYDTKSYSDEGVLPMFNYEDTERPTQQPSGTPSSAPSMQPTTTEPTSVPSSQPSAGPTTSAPTTPFVTPELYEYNWFNTYPGDNKVHIASAFDDNIFTVSTGERFVLSAGEVRIMPLPHGATIKATKPCSLTGYRESEQYELANDANVGRDFLFYSFRVAPVFGFYALADTSITISSWEQGAGVTLLEFDMLAGQVHIATLADQLQKRLFVKSTGDIVVSNWGVDFGDYMNGVPTTHKWYGSPSSGYVVNPLAAEFTIKCSDGSVETSNSWFYRVASESRYAGTGCSVEAAEGTPITAYSVADGSGYNGLFWRVASDFGTVGVLSVESSYLKFISTEPAACTIGTTTVSLAGTNMFEVKVEERFPAGSIVTCDKPTIVVIDPRSSGDEGNLPMFIFSDPCSECDDLDLAVCTENGSMRNACHAICRHLEYTEGSCAPTKAPATLSPTPQPTNYPTTSRPTEQPVQILTTEERVTILQNMLAETTRHVALQQVQAEHDLRSRGSSGVTRIRAYSEAVNSYNADGGLANGGLFAMHNHPNFAQTVGLGEFGAVLNGVRFDTRHNDYKMRKSSNDAITDYNKLETIEFPDVPPSVLEKPDVASQTAEMQEYFRAWKAQDTSIRDYKPYFKAALCYLEGGWVKQTGSLTDPFDSDRHQIDHESWKDLHEAQVFRANSGKKHHLENTPFLPTKIIDVKVDSLNGMSYPVYANFEYRIACSEIDDDLPTARFMYDVPESVLQKYARGRTNVDESELMYTRLAHFKLNPKSKSEWDKNVERGRENSPSPSNRRSFLDSLMEKIPGKDGPLGDLQDDSFHTPSAKYKDYESTLNTAFYSRYFSIKSPDAMGRSEQMRGYNDLNLWAAMTSHERVAGNKVCDDGEGKYKFDRKCWEQKWTYAIPLEIIYMTPLQKWNPCKLKDQPNLATFENGNDGSQEKPYEGYYGVKFFQKTPAEFYSSVGGKDLADTGAGHFARGEDGTVCRVFSSGVNILTHPIANDVGQMRMRWPIFPIHERSSLAFREVWALKKSTNDKMARENKELKDEISALKDTIAQFQQNLVNIIKNSNNFAALTTEITQLDDNSGDGSSTVAPVGENQVGKWNEKTYPVATLVTGTGFEDHTHDIYCDWNCYVSLFNGEEVTITSEDWDGHTHDFTFKLLTNKRDFEFVACDTCNALNDPHDEIEFAFGQNDEVFLPFRL